MGSRRPRETTPGLVVAAAAARRESGSSQPLLPERRFRRQWQRRRDLRASGNTPEVEGDRGGRGWRARVTLVLGLKNRKGKRGKERAMKREESFSVAGGGGRLPGGTQRKQRREGRWTV